MKIANDIVKAITDNYGYHFASWQPNKIKKAISEIDPNIAKVLDYHNPSLLANSLANVLNYDITPLLVEHKYPVWVDLINEEEIKPENKNLVITYIEYPKDSLNDSINRLKEYAKSINSDFVILTGRTQGFVELELGRVKRYAEVYDRIMFLSIDLYLKDNCPNLFDIVPQDKVGIHDAAESLSIHHPDVKKNIYNRIFLMKSEFFQRFPMVLHEINENLKYESSMMNTAYDNSVVISSKNDADIWNAIHFPFLGIEKDDQRWMELLIYREGHDVFELESIYNQNITNLDADIESIIENSYIIKYAHNSEGSNIKNTWLYDNNLIGYKSKEPIDMSQFDIKVLYHSQKQLDMIKDQEYLDYIDLNTIDSKFGYSFTESRMFYEDIDKLFPADKKYIGLVTGSWNKKYIGLNPIDQMHNWAGIRYISDNVVICSDVFPAERFTGSRRPARKPVVKDVFKEINEDHIKEFLELIGIDRSTKYVGVSNQIIAKREIVKRLFEFYQNNEILEKIDFFYDKYLFDAVNEEGYLRRHGYFAETVTVLWMASQDFVTMPQEILKKDWYW